MQEVLSKLHALLAEAMLGEVQRAVRNGLIADQEWPCKP